MHFDFIYRTITYHILSYFVQYRPYLNDVEYSEYSSIIQENDGDEYDDDKKAADEPVPTDDYSLIDEQ